jgi:hypothetical protein
LGFALFRQYGSYFRTAIVSALFRQYGSYFRTTIALFSSKIAAILSKKSNCRSKIAAILSKKSNSRSKIVAQLF